jgi:CHASE2 domain-containing sensor protein
MWTVFEFLKRFTYDLFRAILFQAASYDEELQRTKTTKERMMIWAVIIAVTLIASYGLLYAAWYFIDTLDTSKITI